MQQTLSGVGMETGSCSRCSAPVLWVVSRWGKRMALNPDSRRRVVISGETPPYTGDVVETFLAHVVTCPVKEST